LLNLQSSQFAVKSGREKKLAKISTLVLIAGLAVELLSLVKTSQLSGRLIASLEEQAGQANARAEEAALELAKFKAPRILSLEQQEKIAVKLKLFAGKQFDIALNVEPEPQNFLIQIENILQTAGWIEIDWNAPGNINLHFARERRPKAGIISLTGVIIQMHPEQKLELGAAALALASALSAEGIDARAEAGLGVSNTNVEAIHILIGKKP
jgi:hypothetical protein